MCIYIYLYLYIFLNQVEENYKIPEEQTYMGFGEVIRSKRKNAGYPRRENLCNLM